MRRSKSRALLLLAAFGLSVVSTASTLALADALGPPPTGCPDGTIGDSCHGGQYCRAVTCNSTADCDAGQSCVPRGYCMTPVTCGGAIRLPDGGPVTTTVPSAGPVCTGATDCTGGATCTTQNVCASNGSGPGGLPGTAGNSGCSCQAMGGPAAPIALSIVALGATGIAYARRRARPLTSRSRRSKRP
jgi:hypothetical protein